MLSLAASLTRRRCQQAVASALQAAPCCAQSTSAPQAGPSQADLIPPAPASSQQPPLQLPSALSSNAFSSARGFAAQPQAQARTDDAPGPSSDAPQPAPTSAPSTPRPAHVGNTTAQKNVDAHMWSAQSSEPLLSEQYPSSADDQFGVQKNWFKALYAQIRAVARSGEVPALKGKEQEVFEQVEAEFERLYNAHIRDRGLDPQSHRACTLACLSVATYKVLYDSVSDTRLVREIIRTNLGSIMLALLAPVHRLKLNVLSWLLREDMYEEAVRTLGSAVQDMTGLVETDVQTGKEETVLTVPKCQYYDIFAQEDTPFLITEFCCHHALTWLHPFRKHGVIVSLDECKAWDDSCCKLRVARHGHIPAQTPAQQQQAASDSTQSTQSTQ